MHYLILELQGNQVINSHYCEDDDEQESLFVSIALDYGITIDDVILQKRYIELDDGLAIQLVEVEE